MGRWAQARRRGTAVPAPTGGSLAPPSGDEWTASANFDNTVGAFLNSGTCPVGADGIRASFSLDTNTNPDLGAQVSGACSDVLTSAPFSPGDNVNVWIRYLLGGIPVSDWSAPSLIGI